VNARFKNILGWLLLIWGLVAGVVAWASRKTEKLSAVLIVSAYSAILIHGLFFKPKDELRKDRLIYLGFATILVFWLFLTYAVFVK
jgi:predicted membrane protein